MFIKDKIRLATRTFRTRKLRTFLTVLGISVGIAAILFLVSLGYGLQVVLLEKITRLDALLALDVSTPNAAVVSLDETLINELSEIPHVTQTSPLRSIASVCRFGDVSSQVTLSAVGGSYFHLGGGGDFLVGEAYEGDRDESVVLSRGAIASLGFSEPEDALGKTIGISLVVSANESGSNGNDFIGENEIFDLDASFVIGGVVDDASNSVGFLPIRYTDNLGIGYYDSVKVKVENQEFLEETRNMLVERGLSVLALSDTIDQANKIFSVIQVVLALFGLVALIVSAIGMFNTMTIALLERTNEIGIMKAIGASKRDIRSLFLMESVIIGFSGGVGGIVIGVGAARIVNLAFNMLATRFGGQAMDIFHTPLWFILFILGFSFLIGLLTGVYPSQRASGLNPLVALRYK